MKRLLVFLAMMALAAGATAQLRTIPKEAKTGKLRHVAEMIVEVDGERARLAPGGQIRDTSNRLIVPTAIPADVLVRYQLDAQGMLRRVWLLTPLEQQQMAPPKPPATEPKN